jgi:hypothetical protein
MTNPYRAMCEELVDALDNLLALVNGECPSLLDGDRGGSGFLDIEIDDALTTARALLAQPEPEGPDGVHPFVVRHYTDEERPSIKGNGFDGLEIGEDRQEAEKFITWINKRIYPTPQPVAVSERLPGAEDCLPWPGEPDETHWCWMSRIVNGFSGRFVIWEQVSVGPACRDVYTHWLPANALPLPAGEGAS